MSVLLLVCARQRCTRNSIDPLNLPELEAGRDATATVTRPFDGPESRFCETSLWVWLQIGQNIALKKQPQSTWGLPQTLVLVLVQ